VDLGGSWRAAPADEERRRTFADRDTDDGDWSTLEVPGHWWSDPAFTVHDGAVLHRRRFDAPPPAEGQRAWLVFDGVFYQGDVWLDGTYLGDTEGYFLRHTFEVTEALASASEHLLAVEVTCSRPDDRTAKRSITGTFQHGDIDDPPNPGGIWRPVRLERTGPVRARSLRMLCREATTEQAVVAFRAELDSDAARTVEVRTDVGGVTGVTEHPIAEGSNFVEWTVTVPDPRLWWPHSLGDQPLYDATVEVRVDGATSHSLQRRLGLRSVTWRDWTMSVNGERLFLKGANQGPARQLLAAASADDLRHDVTLAKEAGLDLLRLRAHISRPEIYEAADELGLVLWQDFPLRLGHARSIRKQAVRQAAAMVDHLGHHPSVVLWCGHDTPIALDTGDPPTTRSTLRWAAGQELPTWNKTFLDRSVKRAIEKADTTRPVIAHSGVVPHPGGGGTDSHLWWGWFYGDERDLPDFARGFPRMVRFVSEFGSQSLPDGDVGVPWPVEEGLDVLRRRVPPDDLDSLDAWRAATQAYQSTVVKHHVETLRRLKYRPTGGFCVSSFADGLPGVTSSVLDHTRAPKAAFLALVDACRPVIVVADRLPATVAPGDTLALDVHVVSDLREPLAAARVDAVLRWAGGDHEWHWEGDVGADACARVGTLQAVVPDEPGELALDLVVHAGERVASNRYTTVIVAPA
jgi:beta-mannosidase